MRGKMTAFTHRLYKPGSLVCVSAAGNLRQVYQKRVARKKINSRCLTVEITFWIAVPVQEFEQGNRLRASIEFIPSKERQGL